MMLMVFGGFLPSKFSLISLHIFLSRCYFGWETGLSHFLRIYPRALRCTWENLSLLQKSLLVAIAISAWNEMVQVPEASCLFISHIYAPPFPQACEVNTHNQIKMTYKQILDLISAACIHK